MRQTGLFRYCSSLFVLLAMIVGLFGLSPQPSFVAAAELPPRPPINPQTAQDPSPALVTVVQRPTPNLAVTAGSLVTYTIAATNRGRGLASETIITMPFDPEVVSIVDVVTSRSETWVSRLGVDFIEIRTGPLRAGGDTASATLRVQVGSAVPVGTSVAPRLSFEWNDEDEGGAGSGNLVSLVVAERQINVAHYPLAIESSDEGFLFGASIFLPNELVGLWYVTPGGRNIELGIVRADERGVIDLELTIGDDPPGDYTLVASGDWSGFTAVGEYRLIGSAARR